MTIRPAILADVPRLVEMGLRFLRESAYRDLLTESPEQMTALATHLVTTDGSTVLVVEQDDALLGMLGLIAAPHFLSGELFAGEVFWWVEPDARGTTGVRLWRAGEQWAQQQGAKSMQMIAPNDRVGQLYERRGYVPLERSYTRRLDD